MASQIQSILSDHIYMRSILTESHLHLSLPSSILPLGFRLKLYAFSCALKQRPRFPQPPIYHNRDDFRNVTPTVGKEFLYD
jgi:hypothetical protein